MRTIILVTLLSTASAQAGLSRLEALGMIESGDNDNAVGRAGEVSRYQIQPRIWRRYDASEDYQKHSVSKRVAQMHLAELERVFRRCAGRDMSDFDVYVLWNAGPTYYASVGWKASRVHAVVRERAIRYVNLRHRDDPVSADPVPSGHGPADRVPATLAASRVPEPAVSPAGPLNPFSLGVGVATGAPPASAPLPAAAPFATSSGSERLVASGAPVFSLEPTK